MSDGQTQWARAQLVWRLLSIDPSGLGGLCLRARGGPARDAFVEALRHLPGPSARVPPSATDEHLFGGIDIAATLADQDIVTRNGVLEGAAVLILPGAERLRPDLAARLAQRMDSAAPCVIALDEGIDDTALPEALQDRMAFWLDLDGIGLGDVCAFDPNGLDEARAQLPLVQSSQEQMLDIATLSATLGIKSLRAALFALRAARAHAAWQGRDTVQNADILAAVEVTLAHRATQLPQPEAEPEPTPPEPAQESAGEDNSPDEMMIPQDILLEAIKAALPAGLLEKLASKTQRAGQGAGSGARRKGNRRGRPLPSRAGRLDGTARIDLIATLRAAAPWQTIRAKTARRPAAIHIRPSDIFVKRYEQKSDRLLIFTVDASGSAAMSRLAEAKGAVELLLSEAYARRDHVALVAFRGTGADVLLPPTRSLVQTKRRLAALPGGGGTPLAAGLKTAMELAITARQQGLTPTIALLTDGRANIALDGQANRKQAAEDAQAIGRAVMAQRCDALVIDMGNRPEPALRALCDLMGGPYVPLPRADAHRLSQAVSSALDN
ncbi:MAG: magnesium chelatase subunit D [Sedimentitalea sp.]